MSLRYEGLDEQTRRLMSEEVERDVSNGNLYMSKRFNDAGEQGYVSLLREAIDEHDDSWFADELRNRNYINDREQRRTKNGYTMVKVPHTAPDTLAEGEFNRFYVRGLCRKAVEDGISEVEVYRGKDVSQPRPESEAMLGTRFSAEDLLEDLRQSPGVEPALGLPPGPNSGLTVRLP